MTKKLIVILLVAGALTALAVGVALAQAPEPPVPGTGGYGPGGMMGGYGRGGMMGGFRSNVDGEYGPMHEYMEKALAEALGISMDEFESRREAGETAYQIALAEGFTADEIPALLREARGTALDAAAAAGAIPQDWADWMKARPFGAGSGNCGGMGGWRFQQQSN